MKLLSEPSSDSQTTGPGFLALELLRFVAEEAQCRGLGIDEIESAVEHTLAKLSTKSFGSRKSTASDNSPRKEMLQRRSQNASNKSNRASLSELATRLASLRFMT